mgnify:CR=1 FL=1
MNKTIKTLSFSLFVGLVLLTSCKKDDDNNGDNNTPSCDNQCNVNPAISSDYHATIHSNLVGVYTLTYDEIQEGGPFSDGDQVKFTIASNGSLTIEFNGDCVSIDKALHTYPTDAEVRYGDDCVFNVNFLLSDNQTGTFNEFNITNVSTQQFLGQFHE